MAFPELPKQRTEIELPGYGINIGYRTPLLFLGSCFTSNIGNRLNALKFPVLINPAGTIYNPVSVWQTLDRIARNKKITADEIHLSNGKYFHYDFNTTFSGKNIDNTLNKINSTIAEANKFFLQTQILFITLGTAFVYELKETGTVVANCHKQPASYFDRKLLPVNEIIKVLEMIVNTAGKDKKIIFTVSPIRHLKDGLVNNARNKAHLLAAIHSVAEQYATVFYFPAYEMVMDDLRDYRYYEANLTHLNENAVDYIFYHFSQTFIPEDDQSTMALIHKLNKQLRHIPQNMDKTDREAYAAKLIEKINELESRFPFLDFTTEKKQAMAIRE